MKRDFARFWQQGVTDTNFFGSDLRVSENVCHWNGACGISGGHVPLSVKGPCYGPRRTA